MEYFNFGGRYIEMNILTETNCWFIFSRVFSLGQIPQRDW